MSRISPSSCPIEQITGLAKLYVIHWTRHWNASNIHIQQEVASFGQFSIIIRLLEKNIPTAFAPHLLKTTIQNEPTNFSGYLYRLIASLHPFPGLSRHRL